MAQRHKKILTVLSSMIVLVTIFLLTTSGNAEQTTEEMTEDQKVSYTLGFVVMHRIASQGYQADVDAFSAGMRSVTGDNPPELNPQEMETIMRRVLKAVEIRASRMKPQETAEADGHREPIVNLRPGNATAGQMTLPLNTQIPSGRIDTASPQTRINFILSENPNLDVRDLQ
jgi:Domain amino terminal to FKBP-type peptidyl-prolyl isomerase